ncbi:S-layer homology domain-containing protein [Petroclostridium sp. X23]|uniref:S-layer homology domain-containing protein n=1 Tax=Petroclostridium sp. X23 TaxID=3045146 RepID=UPI0024ADD3EF|nr:S-layer homology domain-containing protein [Petroclostridium sp. X23]WHH58242.1 S-layer homology domain-containing protein [Petroclostridium sp. X23]
MRKAILAVILLLSFCFSTCAAAEALSKVEFSTNSITLDANSNEFSVDILLEKDELFNGALFGLGLEDGLEIKSIEYSDTIEDKTLNKVQIYKKNGIHYFGFYTSENKFSGNIDICTVHFQYTGSAAVSITMEEASITTYVSAHDAAETPFNPNSEVTVQRKNSGEEQEEEEPTGGSGHSSGTAVTTQTQPVNGTISATPQISNGKATVKLDNAAINKAFAQAKSDENGMKTIEIDVKSSGNAKEFSTEIPAQIFSAGEKDKLIKINMPTAAVRLPVNMIPKDQLGNAKNVEINVSGVDVSQLPAEVKETIGNHPVIEINIALDGNRIEWSNEEAPVSISIPYTPTAEELKSPDNIIVYYVDGKGELHAVPSGRYDAATGTVTFSVTHFSQYGVAYAVKSFDDIQGSWAKKEIEALAVRGIINGTSEKTYSPDAKIIRADFTKLLVGVLNKTAKSEAGFNDIALSDYYYQAVNTAKALGLATGTGQNQFNPKGQITRQDMMVLMDRALSISGKTLTKKADLSTYADAEGVAAYAKDSVAELVAAGIIQGSNGKLRPQDNLTRAEAARVLYLIYKLLY